MNDVLRYKIPEYLSFRDLHSFSSTCREYRNMLKETLIAKKNSERINFLFSEKIINMIGKENLLNGEHVKWKDEWLGPTDYIDRVNTKEMTNNISYGRDCYRRSFIFIRVNNIKNDEKETNLLIIFQRYTNGNTYVAIAPSGCLYHHFLKGRCSINEYGLSNDITSLLRNKTFQTEKNDYYEEMCFTI